MTSTAGYAYYGKDGSSKRLHGVQDAILMGQERLNPSLSNPDYLVYIARRRTFEKMLVKLPSDKLSVLDVGGRIQPYRPLFEHRLQSYFCIDPQLIGMVDVTGVGEHLPFRGDCFDLVICTQVLSYVSNVQRVIDEMYRVMRPEGYIFLSAPTLFPRHHDERWRFLPDGFRLLLERFSDVEIFSDGHSIAGGFRTLNVALNLYCTGYVARKVIGRNLIRCSNLAGKVLDRFSRGNDHFAVNHTAVARK